MKSTMGSNSALSQLTDVTVVSCDTGDFDGEHFAVDVADAELFASLQFSVI